MTSITAAQHFELETARKFFDEWRECSIEMMRILCPTCPTFPKGPTQNGKYRRWGSPGSPSGPIGIIYHYTGGPNGIASLRWGNENTANRNSSWHVTVLDHLVADVEDIRKSYPSVAKYLPVTALLHADIHRATWHANWANSRCFGIENRNMGYLELRGGKYGRIRWGRKGTYTFKPLADQSRVTKHAVTRAWCHTGKSWESYTTDQLIANIVIGKMILGWRGPMLDKRWVLPHQFVWASKFDPGPAFPMELVRDAIWNLAPADACFKGLERDLQAKPFTDEHDEHVSLSDNRVYTPVAPDIFDAADQADVKDDWRSNFRRVRQYMQTLGGYCPSPKLKEDERVLDSDLRLATKIFQHSTWAQWRGPKLKTDGLPGPKTLEALQRRLRQFERTY